MSASSRTPGDLKDGTKLPTTELRVIGAGLGRTGTSSLCEALEILGFAPCHHMRSLIGNKKRTIAFRKALEGEPTDWRALMAGWGAAVDNPTTDFVPELMAAFPDALVILSLRDTPEAWWRSLSDTVLRTQSLSFRLAVFSLPFMREQTRLTRVMFGRWPRVYGVPMGPAIYDVHNAQMRKIVPKEKLLEFNVKQGWAPLCEFLGVPVPDVPFPRTNDTAEMKQRLGRVMLIGTIGWAIVFVLGGVVVQQAIKWKPWLWL